MRYFHTVFANRAVAAGNHTIKFDAYALAGSCWLGIYATENDSEIEELSKLPQNPKSGVTEIDAEEFEKCEKKRELAGRGYSTPSLIQPPANATSARPAGVGDSIDMTPSLPEEKLVVGAPLGDVAEAVQIGVIPKNASAESIVEKVAEKAAEVAPPRKPGRPKKQQPE